MLSIQNIFGIKVKYHDKKYLVKALKVLGVGCQCASSRILCLVS